MKSAKTSKNPTINYKLKGSEFEQFLNYETFLSLVKAYTDMRFIICDECKCKSHAPSSIVEGTSSYKCDGPLIEEPCKKCLYPYGKFVNQNVIEGDECFKFPRKITNDPCIKPEPPCPCPPEPCPVPCMPCTKNWSQSMRPCSVKQTIPKDCCSTRSVCYQDTMRPCSVKQTRPCIPCDLDSDSECENPLLKCANPCKTCLRR